MNKKQSDIKKLTQQIKKFCEDRDWNQFHDPKDLSISLMLEAAEVAEHFQWKNPKEVEKHIRDNKREIGEELADVLYWVLLIGDKIGLNLVKAFNEKMMKNEKKYPIAKAKGKHLKYNQLK